MIEIELEKFDTLKKFHIGDNVYFEMNGNMYFGTVKQFSYNRKGNIEVHVKTVDGEVVHAGAHLFTVIK